MDAEWMRCARGYHAVMTSLMHRPQRTPTPPEFGVGRRQAAIAAAALVASHLVVLVIAALNT